MGQEFNGHSRPQPYDQGGTLLVESSHAERQLNDNERACPGCGLRMPGREGAPVTGYYNTSPECWSVYTEVLGYEYGNPALFGQVHQLTVDAYAVQHAGASHPDKSVGVHLCGLYLVLEQGHRPPQVPPLLQRLAEAVNVWPSFPPVQSRGLTVLDVALADSVEAHSALVSEWSAGVWESWSAHHAAIQHLVAQHVGG